jgi:hypothetical protein
MSTVEAVTVKGVDPMIGQATLAPAPAPLDADSPEWLRCLRADGATRDDAVARMHSLLLRAARFEVATRRPSLPYLRGAELDDIANEER